ncbi:MAG: carbohydrate-binding protein, partial [Ferruginibacter sp.]
GTIVYASDYDMGRSGIAYHDIDSAEYWVSTNTRTQWNSGGKYRNDGVDIEACSDDITNGYNVGWIQNGEWLQYSVYAAEKTMYDLNIRVAGTEKSSKLTLLIGNQEVSELLINSNGKTGQWTTNTIRAVQLNKGWNQLRILAAAGGFNLNYFQFISAGSNAGTN